MAGGAGGVDEWSELARGAGGTPAAVFDGRPVRQHPRVVGLYTHTSSPCQCCQGYHRIKGGEADIRHPLRCDGSPENPPTCFTTGTYPRLLWIFSLLQFCLHSIILDISYLLLLCWVA
jgi:hypothetical protein